jgi:hypothetical protein
MPPSQVLIFNPSGLPMVLVWILAWLHHVTISHTWAVAASAPGVGLSCMILDRDKEKSGVHTVTHLKRYLRRITPTEAVVDTEVSTLIYIKFHSALICCESSHHQIA